MSLSLTPKKAIVAVAALAPLIVAGCSSADEETAAKNTSTVTSTSQTATATSTEDPEHKDDKNKDDKDQDNKEKEKKEKEKAEKEKAKDQPAENQPKPQDQAANGGTLDHGGHNGQPVNPFAGGNPQDINVAPVEGGQPADEQTVAEIRSLLDGQFEQTNPIDFFTYMPKNSCSAVLDEIDGGADAFKEENVDPATRAAMDNLFQVAPVNAHIESVTDVQRNGDRASATVTIRNQQGPDTALYRFQNEGGQWKFCK